MFEKFYSYILTQFNVGIRCLQTNGGGEYVSNKFEDFLKYKGIMHMVSCPYTPQQNGIAKMKH